MAMGFGQMLILLCLIIFSHFSHITTAQQPELIQYFCTNTANDTTNSTYNSNLVSVLSSLPNNTISNYGFYNASAGRDPATVHVVALCRGDVSRDICRSCVSNATRKLRELCPNQKEAIGWYDYYMLRYSNDSVFHRADPNFYLVYAWNVNNVSDPTGFNAAFLLRSLLDRLQQETMSGGSLRKFATGNITGPGSLMIYGLMQCTPDLSASLCLNCLSDSTEEIPICCGGKRGGRVIGPSCNLRYEFSSFYSPTPAISLPPPPPPPSPSSSPPPVTPQSQSQSPPGPSPAGKIARQFMSG